MYSIENAIFGALATGKLLGYPMMNTKVIIKGGMYSQNRTNSVAAGMAVN